MCADVQGLAVCGQGDRTSGMADGMLAAQGAPREFFRIAWDHEEGLVELISSGAVQSAAGRHDAEGFDRHGLRVNLVVFATDPDLVDAGRGIGAEVAAEGVSAGLRPAVLPEAEILPGVKEADDGGGLVADDGGLELERRHHARSRRRAPQTEMDPGREQRPAGRRHPGTMPRAGCG